MTHPGTTPIFLTYIKSEAMRTTLPPTLPLSLTRLLDNACGAYSERLSLTTSFLSLWSDHDSHFQKTRICDEPNCGKACGSAQKLWEHKLIHLPYEQRYGRLFFSELPHVDSFDSSRHACGFYGCNYRAHSSATIRIHMNSVQ